MKLVKVLARAGNPTARSRLLAELFGDKAVELLIEGERNKLAGLQDGKTVSKNLEPSVKSVKAFDMKLLHLARELSV